MALIAGEPQPNKQQRQGSAFAVLAVALGAGLLLILLATLRDSGRRTWWGCHPMSRTDNLYELPKNLPVPLNDGACDHLAGLRLPSVELLSTAGRKVDLSTLSGKTVVYCYPRTGRPDQEIPKGWNEIPGARGCTPQSCAFRDHYQQLQALGVRVFGLSTQETDYQREAAQRLQLPFELLSDSEFAFTRALALPTFQVAGMTLIKRLTLIIDGGQITKVFYPVFPPDKNAAEVIQWLSLAG
jgi:peroxiredoxin